MKLNLEYLMTNIRERVSPLEHRISRFPLLKHRRTVYGIERERQLKIARQLYERRQEKLDYYRQQDVREDAGKSNK